MSPERILVVLEAWENKHEYDQINMKSPPFF